LPNSKRLRIAGPALRDLEAIAEFTEEKWGARQKSQYLDAIREKFEEILQTPGLGAPRDYVRPGLRACPAGAHMIYYRETATAVDVLRVLHQQIDPDAQFSSLG